MKKQLLSLMMFGLFGAVSAQNANVSVSNLNTNSYYGGYNSNSKIISGIYFQILADGTNSNYTLDDFEVSLYLLEVGGSTPIKIKTYTISGMHQFASMDYSNESVDLNTVNNLADGQYRLGVWANSDYGIPQPPDQGSDNVFLIKVDDDINKSYINFTAGGGGNGVSLFEKAGLALPNPASASQLNTLLTNSTIVSSFQVYSVLGEEVNMQSIVPGLYLVKLNGLNSSESRMIVIQ